MTERILTIVAMMAACTGLCSSCGPHMDSQQSIHPYSAQMPSAPRGTVPTTGTDQSLIAQQSKLAENPLPASKTNLSNGKIYYGYYCQMCHGEKGDGNGPVGIAYVPKAADITSKKLSKLTDGEVYKRMLSGVGHDPVMSSTVPSDERWPLVMYVRSLR